LGLKQSSAIYYGAKEGFINEMILKEIRRGEMLKTILWWFSGFAGGCFLGALIACPAKALSLPVMGVIAVVF